MPQELAMITSAAYAQMQDAIATLRASLAALEEHVDRLHAGGAPQELTQARVKVQDLYAQVAVLQQRLGRCGDATMTAEGAALPVAAP
jgi:hypothetical protein